MLTAALNLFQTLNLRAYLTVLELADYRLDVGRVIGRVITAAAAAVFKAPVSCQQTNKRLGLTSILSLAMSLNANEASCFLFKNVKEK